MTVATPATVVRHGPAGLPKLTLGWDAMEWAATYLQQPDGLNAGDPWTFTDEQMRFIAWLYAVDQTGAWLYTYSVLRRMKGWGKDPLAAVICAVEMIGPCRFAGWKAAGVPSVVPQPSAWVQAAAVSKEQTRNTMTLFPALFTKRAIAEYGLDIGKEIIYGLGGRAQIQAVTSSPKTIEGARSTFVVQNETHHWLESNDGAAMAKVIRRNTAKVGGRALAITNAHRIGENSVAEADWLKYELDGDDGEMLYDNLEAPPDTDIEDDASLRAGLEAARGDSAWVPIERLMIDARDIRDPEPTRRRYYLNQLRQETSTWISNTAWEAANRQEDPPAGTLITAGFDGSRFNDTTALVATVVETGYQWVVQAWERPKDAPEDWEVPEEEVNLAVDALYDRFEIWRMYCDPYWWEDTISHWAGRHGKSVAFFRTNRETVRLTRAIKSYETAVTTREMGHEADRQFALHIAHVKKSDVNIKDENGEKLYLIRKESKNSPNKIDIAMAAVLSWAARTEAIASGVTGHSVYEDEGVGLSLRALAGDDEEEEVIGDEDVE